MNRYNELVIYNEKGILDKRGASFYNPSAFAMQNLFYTVWSNEYVCSSQYSVRREYLNYFSLMEITEGALEVEYDGRQFTVSQGDLLLLDFRRPHFYHTLGNRLVKWEMLFRGNSSEAYFSLIEKEYGYVHKIHSHTYRVLKGLQSELLSPFPDDHRISSAIHSLLTSLMTQERPAVRPIIQVAIEYIRRNFSEPLKVEDIAKKVSLSKYHFSRIFYEDTGYTPHDYLLNIRIQEAKEMLTEQQMSVAEVGEACGFVNTSHFVRVFKANVGRTPASFKNFFNMI